MIHIREGICRKASGSFVELSLERGEPAAFTSSVPFAAAPFQTMESDGDRVFPRGEKNPSSVHIPLRARCIGTNLPRIKPLAVREQK